jgi:hypothetical protein
VNKTLFLFGLGQFNIIFSWLKQTKSRLQWKPRNVIALVQGQSDNINRMITIAEFAVS